MGPFRRFHVLYVTVNTKTEVEDVFKTMDLSCGVLLRRRPRLRLLYD